MITNTRYLIKINDDLTIGYALDTNNNFVLNIEDKRDMKNDERISIAIQDVKRAIEITSTNIHYEVNKNRKLKLLNTTTDLNNMLKRNKVLESILKRLIIMKNYIRVLKDLKNNHYELMRHFELDIKIMSSNTPLQKIYEESIKDESK